MILPLSFRHHNLWALCILCTLACPFCLAQEAPETIPPPCQEREDEHYDHLPWLDRTHLKLSRRLCRQITRFDRFFGEIQYHDDYTESFIRIRNSVIWQNETSTVVKFRPRIKAKINLPNVENHFNLIISDDSEDQNTLSTANEVVPEDNNQTNKISTTLRWIAKKSKEREINFDIGARANDGLTIFTRARYRKKFMLNQDELIRFTQDFFWQDKIGFGERTELDYEHLIKPNILMRWSNSGTFSQESSGVDWTQRLTLYHQMDPLHAISYNFALSGSTRPVSELKDFGVSIRFRKDLYGHWLFGEIEPEANWPVEFDREFTPKITFRLEVQLGQL